MKLLAKKTFPKDYPKDAIKVIKLMSFSEGKEIEIIGSSALVNQKYIGDYDIDERVYIDEPSEEKACETLKRKFQAIIRRLLDAKVHIGDIKAGMIPQWDILGDKYDWGGAVEKVERMLEWKIISPSEATEAKRLLHKTMTPSQMLDAKEKLKYHIVRWTPDEVLKGETILLNKRPYDLAKAFISPSRFKLDCVEVVDGVYTDFGMVYTFYNQKKVMNPTPINIRKELTDAIQMYAKQKNYFKVVKRKFALAKLEGKTKKLEEYHAILNSDLGKIYKVYTDVGTLINLLEQKDANPSKLRSSLRIQASLLKSILPKLLPEQPELLKDFAKALTRPNPAPILKHIQSQLYKHLSQPSLIGGYNAEEVKAGLHRDEKSKRLFYEPFINAYSVQGRAGTYPDPAQQQVQTLLRDLAKTYQESDPAKALGFRVLSDELWRQYHSPNMYSPLDDEHLIAENALAQKILGSSDTFTTSLKRKIDFADIKRSQYKDAIRSSTPGTKRTPFPTDYLKKEQRKLEAVQEAQRKKGQPDDPLYLAEMGLQPK